MAKAIEIGHEAISANQFEIQSLNPLPRPPEAARTCAGRDANKRIAARSCGSYKMNHIMVVHK